MKKLFITLLISITFYSTSIAFTGEVVKSFSTPGSFPTGLTFDGKNLWLADRETDKIYCINPETGKVIREIESPAYWPTGLAWDGENLWNADFRGRTDVEEDYDGMIFKIDPKDGTVLKTLKAPSSSPKGLTWDGEYLWCVDDRTDKVIQFNPYDGTTIQSFPSPAKNPKGITYDGKYLWISDETLSEVYMVDPNTGLVIIILDAPGKAVHGLAVNNNSLWAVDYDRDKIYQLKIKDDEHFIQKDKKLFKVTYKHQVRCYGPGKIKELNVEIPLPENRNNQRIIGDISYNIKPDKISTDQWGQRTASYNFENIKPGEKTDIQVTTNYEASLVRYFLYPEQVGELADIPKDIKDKYLVDDEKYQINSDIIQNIVKQVVGNEKNPYWIMRNLYQYLLGQLNYNMDGYWDTAPTVLTNGHGSCSEYSFTFIALCRAAGLPARYVGSTWNRANHAYMDEVYHRWPEIYLPNYGWVPIDPTYGDRYREKGTPRDHATPIGFVSNMGLITTQSGGGSTTLEWNYNRNENYITEPKTNLNVIHYADWEVIDENKK